MRLTTARKETLTMRTLLVTSLLWLAFGSGAPPRAWGSQEQFAVWSRVRIDCEPCGKAGKVSVEATVSSGTYRSMRITAFGREHALDAQAVKQLSGFPLSSIRVTHEAGYAEVGGYSLHVRLERLFHDGKKQLRQETALITICEGEPGKVTLSKSQEETK